MAKYLFISATSDIAQNLYQKISDEHEIHLTSRKMEKLKSIYDANNLHELDPANFESMNNLVEKLGELDAIICFSGSMILKPAHNTSSQELQAIIQANLLPAFSVVQAAGKYLENCSIILFSSAAALKGIAAHEAIASAKSAIIGLTKSAAASYATKNLRFNALAPGLINTKLTKNITSNKLSLEASIAMHPLQRIGEPKDVTNILETLIDPKNTWITGQIIAIDGGLSSLQPKMKI